MTTDIHATDMTDTDRLSRLVPTIDPTRYAHRDLNGVDDLAMITAARDLRYNVLVEGPTGTGKTLLPEVWAAEYQRPMVVVPVNAGLDPGTLWGQMTPRPDGSWSWVDSNLALVWRHGGVVVFDECDMAHPRTMTVTNDPLSDAGRVTVLEHGGDTFTRADDLVVVATLNGRGYEGTANLNVAFRRRFKWAYKFDYDRAVESQLVASSTLLDVAFELRDKTRHPDIRTDLATPTLEMVEETAGVFGVAFALERLVHSFDSTERSDVRRAVEMIGPRIATELGVSL